MKEKHVFWMHVCVWIQGCAKLCTALKKNSIGRNDLLIGGVSSDLGGDVLFLAFVQFTFGFLLFPMYISHKIPAVYTTCPEKGLAFESDSSETVRFFFPDCLTKILSH